MARLQADADADRDASASRYSCQACLLLQQSSHPCCGTCAAVAVGHVQTIPLLPFPSSSCAVSRGSSSQPAGIPHMMRHSSTAHLQASLSLTQALPPADCSAEHMAAIT